MKKLAFVVTFSCLTLVLQAQPFRSASDANPIIAEIDNALSVKHYNGTFGDSYTYVFTADTIKKTLLKAVVHDKGSKSTRTYYFHNDYLLKVIEHFEQPAPISTALYFFLNMDYALSIDYKDSAQPELLVRQRLQNDAYKFLLYFRQVNRQ